MEKEIWSPVKELSDYYEVSTYGRVKSVPRMVNSGHGSKRFVKGGFRKPCLGTTGYWHLTFVINGKTKAARLHRMVAEAFIPNPENKPCVNHRDGDKLNNHVNNLEWCTYSENSIHAHKTGLSSVKKGEDVANSIFKTADVLRIRELFEMGVTQPELQKIYSASYAAINSIVRRRTWKHLP